MSSHSTFELLGHDCPLAQYPAPVAPVGRLDGELVCLFANPDGSVTWEIIPEESNYVSHDGVLAETLAKFDFLHDRLFAFSAESVVLYSFGRELSFFEQLLSERGFSAENPFVRLALAKRVGTHDAFLREIRRCVKYLQNRSPNFLLRWYEAERAEISQGGPDMVSFDLPADWREVLAPVSAVAYDYAETFQRTVAQYCQLLSHSPIRRNLKLGGTEGDLYFRELTDTGHHIRTLVECKAWRDPITSDAVEELLKNWRNARVEHPFDRMWIVSSAGFTERASAFAKEHGVELLSIDDLAARSARTGASFFIEEPTAIFGRESKYAFFARRSDYAVDNVRITAEYLDLIQSAATRAPCPLVILDLSAWESDFSDKLRDPLNLAPLEATLRYQISSMRPSRLLPPVNDLVCRHYLLTPSRLSAAGIRNLRSTLLWHVTNNLPVALSFGGSGKSQGLIQIANILRQEIGRRTILGKSAMKTPLEALEPELHLTLRRASFEMMSEGNQLTADRLIHSEEEVEEAVGEVLDQAA
jgi:hypothetical protein